MPSSFEEREKGFEAKWIHDQELRFQILSRRNRNLGLWAATEMGLNSADGEAYAREIVAAEFEKDSENRIFSRIRRDFDSRNVSQSDHMIRRKMEDLLESARAEVEHETRK